MKRFLKSAALWTGVWFLSAFLFVFLFTHRLFGRSGEPTPAIDWGTVESFRLPTCDGEDLGAWYVDNSTGTGPAVLLLHGVKANRYQLLGHAMEFHRRGCPVMLISHRGHGESSGGYCDVGFSCGPDVVAAVDWLRERNPGRKVVVWGTSMGAAAALFGAEACGDKVAGYILECPYQNLHVATRNRTKAFLPPGVEAAVYHTLLLVGPSMLPELDRIAPEEAAGKMPPGTPVLILAGEHDFLATPEESRAIAERIGPSAKVVVAPGGRHTNLWHTNRELIASEVDAFLSNLP